MIPILTYAYSNDRYPSFTENKCYIKLYVSLRCVSIYLARVQLGMPAVNTQDLAR